MRYCANKQYTEGSSEKRKWESEKKRAKEGRTGGEAVELFKVDGALGADGGEDGVSGLSQVRG